MLKQGVSIALLLCFMTINVVLGEKRSGDSKEIVISATKLETPSDQIGNSVTVVTASEIETMQKTSVLEVLRFIPALDVVQTGGPGKTASIYIRGAKPEHTLVLIDGIEMHDPVAARRNFNPAFLTVDNIERIEILRGPQSTLYGSDAIGGVINIVTKKGKGSLNGSVAFEAGSFNTYRQSLGLNGGNEKINYSLAVSNFDTEGFSAANEDLGNREDDGFENRSLSARVGIATEDNLDLDFFLRWMDSETELDNSGGVGGDDINYLTESTQLFFRTQASFTLLDDQWEQIVGFSITDHQCDLNNGFDVDHPNNRSWSFFDGRLLKFDWQNNFYFDETHTITAGLETEEEKGESEFNSVSSFGPFTSAFGEETARTTGYYIQDQIKINENFFATIGARIDDHNRFGTKDTYRFSSSYHVENSGLRVKGSYGTGFKTPTLFQLFSSFGNPDLKPEESTGWDVGIEQSINDDQTTFSVTYFNNDFENIIEFDSDLSTYSNVAKATTEGVELTASTQLSKKLSVNSSYTYTDTEDKTSGEELFRRARDKVGVNVNYELNSKTRLNLNALYVGERDFLNRATNPDTRKRLDGYTLVNLGMTVDLSESFQVFGRIENLFDEAYEEVFGYGTAGVSVFVGFKMLLGHVPKT